MKGTKMKIVKIFLTLFVVISMLFNFVSCQKDKRINDEENTEINKIMQCTLPTGAKILEKTRKSAFLSVVNLGVKTTMTKDDYKTFILTLSNKYEKCNLEDCFYDTENDDTFIYLPNSVGNYIGIETNLYEWWDLDIQDVDCIFYMEAENSLGAKHVSEYRIYVVETAENMLLYLSYNK